MPFTSGFLELMTASVWVSLKEVALSSRMVDNVVEILKLSFCWPKPVLGRIATFDRCSSRKKVKRPILSEFLAVSNLNLL